jgi:hypothetical protein
MSVRVAWTRWPILFVWSWSIKQCEGVLFFRTSPLIYQWVSCFIGSDLKPSWRKNFTRDSNREESFNHPTAIGNGQRFWSKICPLEVSSSWMKRKVKFLQGRRTLKKIRAGGDRQILGGVVRILICNFWSLENRGKMRWQQSQIAFTNMGPNKVPPNCVTQLGVRWNQIYREFLNLQTSKKRGVLQ